MKLYKHYVALGMLACGLLSGLGAHADEFNQETKLTFNTPVEVPGRVLAAGTYTFKLVDPNGDQSLVEILDANQTKVYATLQANPIYRVKPTLHTAVMLSNTGAGSEPVLTEWFYPERKTGFQFIYPANEERKLDQAKEQTVIAQPGALAAMQAGE